MKLKDLKRDVYLCPMAPIVCRFEGFRFLTDEPLRQLCQLSDDDTRIDLVLATAATVALGLVPGEPVEAIVGIRIGQGWGRVEVLALQRSAGRATPVPERSTTRARALRF